MVDDARLAPLGAATPEGALTPGYGNTYLFLVGRDNVHGVLKTLLAAETLFLKMSMYGYDDQELNTLIVRMMGMPNCSVQLTLDKTQASGKTEAAILAADRALDPAEYANSVAIGTTETGDIVHTKGGVLLGSGVAFEGSTNWSTSGEGIDPGRHAQSNTLLVTTNPVVVQRFTARLDYEHTHLKHVVAQLARQAASGAP